MKSDVTPPATGDGVADDTAAIQKVLDGVGSGSTVYLPAGTYRITNTLVLKSPGRGGVLTGVLIRRPRPRYPGWSGTVNRAVDVGELPFPRTSRGHGPRMAAARRQ